jgi:hypothetical protein
LGRGKGVAKSGVARESEDLPGERKKNKEEQGIGQETDKNTLSIVL